MPDDCLFFNLRSMDDNLKDVHNTLSGLVADITRLTTLVVSNSNDGSPGNNGNEERIKIMLEEYFDQVVSLESKLKTLCKGDSFIKTPGSQEIENKCISGLMNRL